MTEHSIVIKIEGTETASKLFHDVSNAADDAGKKVDKGFNKKLSDLGKTSTDLGKKLSVGVTAPLALVGGVSVNAALKAERFRTSLEGLAGGADEAAGYIEAIQTASLGTISQLDAMAFSTKALTLGVVDNSAAMADLTEIAITLGRAQGISATQAVDDLTTALGRQSPLILDNLGITLKLSEAYQIQADALGKQVGALTDAEKQQAFLNAALIKGKEVAADLGGVTLDNAAKVERLKAQASDLAVELGTSLLPLLETGADILSAVVGWFADLTDEQKELVVALGLVAAGAGPVLTAFGSMASTVASLSSGVAGLAGKLGLTTSALGPAAVGVAALAGAYIAYNEIQKRVAEGEEKVANRIEQLGQSAQNAIDAGGDLNHVMGRMADAANNASAAFESHGTAGNILADIFVNQKGIMQDVGKEAGQIALANALATGSYSDLTGAIDTYNAGVTDTSAKVSALTEAQFKAAQSARDVSSTIDNLLFGTMGLTTEMEKEAWVVDTASGAFEMYGQRAQEAAAAQAGAAVQLQAANTIREAEVNQRERANQLALAHVEAMAAEKAAADELARAEANRLVQLTGITAEQFKQDLFAEIDPAKLGVEAYAELGVNLGILDEKSANLAVVYDEVVAAFEDGLIPAENSAAAINEIFTAADKTVPVMADILEKYGSLPEVADPATSSMETFGLKVGEGEQALVKAVSAADDFESLLNRIAREWDVKINVSTTGSMPTGTEIPQFQGGGVVPGPLGQPVLAMVHGGEEIRPPGHPGAAETNNTFNDTYNVSIYDQVAGAMFLEQQRQRRFARLEDRL